MARQKIDWLRFETRIRAVLKDATPENVSESILRINAIVGNATGRGDVIAPETFGTDAYESACDREGY